VERVAVDGAGLPVLDLDEARAFGGASVLQGRLQGAQTQSVSTPLTSHTTFQTTLKPFMTEVLLWIRAPHMTSHMELYDL